MELFDYLMAKKGHNLSARGDLFSYLLGKNVGGSGTYTTFSGISLNISNTLKAPIKNLKLNPTETTQSTTPTPESPVDVNVIKGNNNIILYGKNLFDKDNATYLDNANVSSSSVINIENNFALIYLKLKAGTYNISNDIGSYQWLISDCEDIPVIGESTSPRQVVTETNTTYTLSSERYLLIRVAKSTISINDFIQKLQITEGEEPLPYKPYEQAQNFSINLDDLEYAKIGDYEDEIIETTGKNLFDKDNANLVQLIKASGGDYFVGSSGIKSFYIKVKPNTKYTIQKILSNRFNIYLSEEKPARNVAITTYVSRNAATSISITTGTNDNYLTVYFWVDSDTLTEQEILDTIMINEGEEMLPYEPYGVGELYLKENVGKVLLDGSETYTSIWFYPDAPRFGVSTELPNALTTTGATQYIQMYSNRFLSQKQEDLWTAGLYSEGICMRANNAQLIIKNNNISTPATSTDMINDFKNWISTHNIKVYYPMTTPIFKKIPIPLLEQLENMNNNATSYEGQTNITQTNDDLPFNISVDVKVKTE